MVPEFWDFLAQKAEEGAIASPAFVLEKELTADEEDAQDILYKWARPLKGVLFLDISESIQADYAQVVQYVEGNTNYKRYWVTKFLDGADPWVIAYAKALGGRIVTFETPQPEAKKPKIPDVASYFHISCITLWDMLVS